LWAIHLLNITFQITTGLRIAWEKFKNARVLVLAQGLHLLNIDHLPIVNPLDQYPTSVVVLPSKKSDVQGKDRSPPLNVCTLDKRLGGYLSVASRNISLSAALQSLRTVGLPVEARGLTPHVFQTTGPIIHERLQQVPGTGKRLA
jgi:hypothetical protein